MSFSSDVKQELAAEKTQNPRHCKIAEILALINNSANINFKYHRFFISVNTDNVFLAFRFHLLITEAFSYSPEVSFRHNLKKGKKNIVILIKNHDVCYKILKATSLLQYSGHNIGSIDSLIVKNECCRRAYLRGTFLACGSMSDPAKNYHLEFVFQDLFLAENTLRIMDTFALKGKIIKRKQNYVLYLKEGEDIVDFLNIIGAHNCLMSLENIRIIKDISNNVNRIVNCETANLTKTVNAAVKQIEDINYIYNFKGKNFLQLNLREIADLRLAYPNATLKEIGDLAYPPISKSGVNHRLRKISDIAEKLRRD